MQGPGWQCIIGTDFGSFVAHYHGCFIYFYIGSLASAIHGHCKSSRWTILVCSTGHCWWMRVYLHCIFVTGTYHNSLCERASNSTRMNAKFHWRFSSSFSPSTSQIWIASWLLWNLWVEKTILSKRFNNKTFTSNKARITCQPWQHNFIEKL